MQFEADAAEARVLPAGALPDPMASVELREIDPDQPSLLPGNHQYAARHRNSSRLPQLSLHTPVGDLTISEDGGAIVAIDWGWGRDQDETELLVEARCQLHDYFDGKRTRFTFALAPAGTAYQRRVWQALCDIPPGSTCTYGDVARTAGGSPRAVGGANGRNPIPIVIPCHRVVASTGIGGYSGGDGLPTKRFLLALEGAAADDRDLFAAARSSI